MASPPLLPPQPPLDFITVLSESKRIINAHSRHFLALSVLFLLPLSFSTTIYPTLHHLLTHPVSDHPKLVLRLALSGEDDPPIGSSSSLAAVNPRALSLAAAYSAVLLLSSLFAAGSITGSVLHGFYGRPVKLKSAVGSAIGSFLPLLATALVTQIFVSLICVSFGLFLFLSIKGFQLLGFEFHPDSTYFSGFCLVVLIVLVLVLVHLQVNWSLAFVIVVVESNWGFGPLRRSASLVKGMRRVALSLIVFFGLLAAVLVWSSSFSAARLGGGSNGWKSWAFVVQIVVISALVTLLMLYSFAATTVLYMYCKAVHGELAVEIAEEFRREYVSLPFDREKVPHVVSVVYA